MGKWLSLALFPFKKELWREVKSRENASDGQVVLSLGLSALFAPLPLHSLDNIPQILTASTSNIKNVQKCISHQYITVYIIIQKWYNRNTQFKIFICLFQLWGLFRFKRPPEGCSLNCTVNMWGQVLNSCSCTFLQLFNSFSFQH